MKNLKTINSGASIKEAISESFELVATRITDLTPAQLNYKPEGKWSIAENLSHLIVSTYPVASALNKSKMMFRIFGTAKNGSRTYEEMYAFYKEKLGDGVDATGTGYGPKAEDVADVQKMLENWKMIGAKFEARIEKWSENDLDKYRVPHPVMEKLTFREMLFFTHFHNLIHLDIINQRLSEHG